MTKRRILFVGEASYLATGFGVYWNEVLKRLYQDKDLEIAELGSYAYKGDPRNSRVPWKFYPVIPDRNDKDAMNEYSSIKINEFGAGIFEEVCLEFKPQIVCVPPGTKVETPNGIKNIEDVAEGELVIAHTGKARKVLKTMRRQHIGDIIRVYPHNDNTSYSFTPEHPVLAIQSRKRTWRQRDVQERHLIEDATFIQAKNLGVGDYVLIPIYRPENECNDTLDCTNFLNQFILDDQTQQIYPAGHTDYRSNNEIPRYINITKDLARLFGYYCAKGSNDQGSIRFSFGTTEQENGYVNDVRQLLQRIFGLETRIQASKVSNCQDIVCNSRLLFIIMAELIGKGAHNKRVPDCIWQSNNHEVIKSFLEGLIKGDGCYKSDTVSLCTVSEKLARQVRTLFARLGIKASITERLTKSNGFTKVECLSFDVSCYGPFARLAHEFIRKHDVLPSRVADNPKWQDKGTHGWITKDYIVVPIRRIRKDTYHGQVYNLEVEQDNSYVTGFAVHNCAIRDFWMDSFILDSPYRDLFKFLWMATIDGEPQRDLWLDYYKRCDGILTYSHYGMDLLKKTGRHGTKLIDIASPGADLDVFKPPDDKRAHKAKLGIDPDAIIIGTVQRNQARKKYYDLIEAFSIWQNKANAKGRTDLTKRTFLYLHTSYPDVGYDIGKAIREFNVGNRVVMTYLCSNCHTAYPAFFSGSTAICTKCKQYTAHPPNASHGVSREVLAEIMKAFDLYVQYSVCLHPETPIMTSNGWETIGNIKIDDQVIGSDGKLHRVYKTMKNPSDACYDVKVKGRPWSVTATWNHPWVVVDQTKLSRGLESIGNKDRDCNKLGKPRPKLNFIYKQTEELQPGDLLVSRIPTDELLPKYDLPFMDDNMAYYLGLFAADGNANTTNGNNRITLSDKDSVNIEKICDIAKTMNKKGRIRDCNRYGKKAVDVDINGMDLTNQLRALLYTSDKVKQLPYQCHLWPRNLQEQLVRGLMAGDGHWSKRCEWLNVFCTTSVHIAKMLCPILERLGWYYCCSVQHREASGRLPMYRFEIRTDRKKANHETLYRDGFVLTKVKSCEKSEYSGEVVNIDVEDDHHYVTLEGLKHNCEGWALPIGDATACGVPAAAVDYSAMQDHLMCPTNIPIPVGSFFRESVVETEQKRALPDNEKFADIIDKFVRLSESVRTERAIKTRQYAIEPVATYGKMMPRYSFDRTAEIWRNVLKNTEVNDISETWLSQTPRIITPDLKVPKQNMSNSEFVNWAISNVLRKPDMLNTCFANDWLEALNTGLVVSGDRRVPFDRNTLIQRFLDIVSTFNHAESQRIAITSPNNKNGSINGIWL